MFFQTIHLVDDDPGVREGISLLLETAGFAVKTYASAENFLSVSAEARFDCLVLDLRMPEMNGLELQAELAQRSIEMPIIFISAYGDIPTTVQAMRNGAIDFLPKPVDGPNLIEQVRLALKKAGKRKHQESAKDELLSRLALLSKREQQVLACAIAGKSNKEIADQLGISLRTVESHRSRIFLRTGVTSLLDLLQQATAAGVLLSLSDQDSGPC
jgi:FixJ family two-component response regulator